jgi:hypothetical protein
MVDRHYNVQAGTKPDDGSPIPFLQWSQAVYDAAQKATEAGAPWTPNNQRCLVAGVLRAMKGNFPWSLIVTKKEVIQLFEEDGRVNEAPFRAEHQKHYLPTWYGDPIARWDGDALVIDTIGFNEKTPFEPATYHTPMLHTTMRIRLINGGKNLEVRTLIDDPGAYSKPWENLMIFNRMAPGYKIREYRCIENNRDLPSIGLWGPH